MPDVDQAAMQILCDSYTELCVEHGDTLPDLRTVSVTFEFPPGATRLKGFRIRTAPGQQHTPVAQSVAAAALPAVKAWVQRVVIGMNVCPYTKDIGVSPAGMEKRGVTPGRT
eukprot:16710-Heterococcus_DN1.PRE.1